MIDAVVPGVLTLVRADAQLASLWAGVKPIMGETAPYLFSGVAPDDWPKPYVVYGIYEEEDRYDPSIWPMKSFRFEFVVYDYAANSTRCMRIATRIAEVLAYRGIQTNPDRAYAVRLYEHVGPVMVEARTKKDVAYMVTFNGRGGDGGALLAKTEGTR